MEHPGSSGNNFPITDCQPSPPRNRRIMQPIRRAMSHEEVIAKSKKNQRREMISHPNSDRRHHPTKG